ncbi:hypothetical protein [Plesiomonas shigelloides]|uniref:hypothetical protein n=1 Tax=Plesiomonas shigelloides TaxID=703 RepID=UPI00126161DC|nr:hypothetical protein [Plesiomonas shigelloides]KAB7693256.1 hypothetical protein GBN20_00205 [Plesiomonas shigelloides]
MFARVLNLRASYWGGVKIACGSGRKTHSFLLLSADNAVVSGNIIGDEYHALMWLDGKGLQNSLHWSQTIGYRRRKLIHSD